MCLQLEFVRRRYHKDLLLNPVLMLNFSPDLLSEPTELQQASRELIFLIDNSNTMTQHNINKIKVFVILLYEDTFCAFWYLVHDFSPQTVIVCYKAQISCSLKSLLPSEVSSSFLKQISTYKARNKQYHQIGFHSEYAVYAS